jgi:hypothetical protein
MVVRPTTLSYIDLVNEVTAPLPPIPIARMTTPPWQPLAAPLDETTVMLVSSAGVHFRSDPPFVPVDDLSFRRIPADTDPTLLRPSHPSPIRRPGLIDLNVVHPAQRLAELAAQGVIGGLTDHHLAMLGAIKSLVPMVTEMGPAMAADAREAGAGLVMLVPLCPACHQAVGLLARVIEREVHPDGDSQRRTRHHRAGAAAARRMAQLPARVLARTHRRSGRAARDLPGGAATCDIGHHTGRDHRAEQRVAGP